MAIVSVQQPTVRPQVRKSKTDDLLDKLQKGLNIASSVYGIKTAMEQSEVRNFELGRARRIEEKAVLDEKRELAGLLTPQEIAKKGQLWFESKELIANELNVKAEPGWHPPKKDPKTGDLIHATDKEGNRLKSAWELAVEKMPGLEAFVFPQIRVTPKRIIEEEETPSDSLLDDLRNLVGWGLTKDEQDIEEAQRTGERKDPRDVKTGGVVSSDATTGKVERATAPLSVPRNLTHYDPLDGFVMDMKVLQSIKESKTLGALDSMKELQKTKAQLDIDKKRLDIKKAQEEEKKLEGVVDITNPSIQVFDTLDPKTAKRANVKGRPAVVATPSVGPDGKVTKKLENKIVLSIQEGNRYAKARLEPKKQRLEIKKAKDNLLKPTTSFTRNIERIHATERIMEFLDSANPIADAIIKRQLFRLSGDVGPIREPDLAAMGASPALIKQFYAAYDAMIGGRRFEKDAREDAREVVSIINNFARMELNRASNNFVNDMSLVIDEDIMNKDQIRDFLGINRLIILDSKREADRERSFRKGEIPLEQFVDPRNKEIRRQRRKEVLQKDPKTKKQRNSLIRSGIQTLSLIHI